MNLNKIPQLIIDLRDYDRRTDALIDEAADALEQMLQHIIELFYKVAKNEIMNDEIMNDERMNVCFKKKIGIKEACTEEEAINEHHN